MNVVLMLRWVTLHASGETLLQEAVMMSSKVGLVKPNDHIVVVQMIHDALIVKVSRRSLGLFCEIVFSLCSTGALP